MLDHMVEHFRLHQSNREQMQVHKRESVLSDITDEKRRRNARLAIVIVINKKIKFEVSSPQTLSSYTWYYIALTNDLP